MSFPAVADLATLQAPLRGVLADLVLAGVMFEAGDQPLGWQVKGPSAPLSPMAEGLAAPAPEGVAVTLPVPQPRPRVVARETEAPVKMPPAELWQDGAPGGVVLVLRGAPPSGAAAALLEAMLQACGLQELPRARVGLTGGQVQPGQAKAAVAALAPQRVLLLGEEAILALTEAAATAGAVASLDVESWHRQATLPAGYGATFPLGLMLQHPGFKKRAWQHLRRWLAAPELSLPQEELPHAA